MAGPLALFNSLVQKGQLQEDGEQRRIFFLVADMASSLGSRQGKKESSSEAHVFRLFKTAKSGVNGDLNQGANGKPSECLQTTNPSQPF